MQVTPPRAGLAARHRSIADGAKLRGAAAGTMCATARAGATRSVTLGRSKPYSGTAHATPHARIARHLREDRRGHDRAVAGIAPDPRFRRAGKSTRQVVAVDAGRVRGVGHAFQGFAHAGHRRLENVEAVDHLHVHEHDLPRQRALLDARGQHLAPGGGQPLGIVEAVDARTRGIQHHRGKGVRPAARVQLRRRRRSARSPRPAQQCGD